MGDVRRRKRPANQAKPAEVTNSIQIYTTTSDGPVTASTTRFMKSSNSLKSTATQLPSSKDTANNQSPSHELARACSRGAPVKWPSLRAALTLVVKLKPQSPKQLPNPQICALCRPQKTIEGPSATSRPWSPVYS